MFETTIRSRNHRVIQIRDGARHFSQPKMPKMPQQTEAPPDRSDADKEAARRLAEQQRQATGRRSTLVAGAGTPQTLGTSDKLGGSGTLLGGGGATA